MKKLTLFEITSEYLVLKDLSTEIEVDKETGEITDNTAVLQELYDGINDSLDKKLDGTMYVIKELQIESKALKEEAKRLTARAKVLDNKEEKLKNMMFHSIDLIEDKKIKTAKFNFYIKKNQPSVKVDSVEDLPRGLRKATWTADKKAIKDALMSNISVAGCSLVESSSLVVK